MSKRTPEEIIHSVERYQRGETSQGAEAKRLGVSQQTFQDWIRKHETFGIDGFEHTGHRNYPRELKKSVIITSILLFASFKNPWFIFSSSSYFLLEFISSIIVWVG